VVCFKFIKYRFNIGLCIQSQQYIQNPKPPRILSCGISKAGFLKKKRPIRELVKEESEWANVFHGESF
jgi:hypothetical protein